MVAASSLRRRGYDVFLSFRGDDTRNGFTGHLYEAMKRKGIRVFIDNRGLEKGRGINPQLTRAIEDSRFAVVVFSKQYADSTWCLDEVAKIHDGMREEGFTALPVFYHVRSSDVREHKGCFEGAFQKHGNRGEDPLRVSRWKTALTTVATQTGWTVDDRTNEADIVEAIARGISSKRWVMFPGIASELVGFESQIDPVVKMMDFKSDSSRIIGITGMGGIGKSAIARAVYERMLGLFDVGSFLANIGRNSVKNGGLVSLQKQLLTETSREENVNVFNEKDGIKRIRSQLGNRKVILVLDDIDGPEQFEALAGDLDWFGPGSRILITTRDKHLLRNAHFTNEIQLLSNDDARDLFRWNAFGREETVSTDFEPMFDKVVDYCGGLPLALKELGCLLAGKTMTEWENSIDKLKENPNRRIMDRLEISYASLDETQKSTFLYIACFLADAMEEDMKFIMDCLGLFPHINIKTLMERCLVSVSEGRVQMHNLLRELGRDLARRESPAGPTKQLIMCSFPDIQKALDMEMGSGSVEALVLDQSAQQSQHGELLSLNGLSRFDKLKLLHINEVYNFSGKLNSLSNEMKHLVWHGCPLKWLPSNFQPHGLCYLDLCSSNITNLWDYNQRLDKLTRVILCNSKKLIKCPDLSNLPNLQSLNLEGCISLIELCSSRPLHERLSNLNLRGCTRLRHLPKQIHFPSLETFVLSGCVSLTRLPEISGPMARLTELHLDGSSILEVPPSYYFLTGLVQLNASNCARLLTPPRTILDMMKNLICIIQDGCISSIKMPVDLEKQNLDPPRAEAEAQQVLGSGPVTFFKYIVARTKTYTKYELQVGVQEKPLESYQILLRVLRSPACVRVLEKPLKSYQHLLRVFRSPTHEVPKEGLLKSYWQLLRVSRGPQRVGVQEKPLKSYQNVLRIFRRSPRVGVEETPLESSQRLLRVFRSPWCARMQEKPSKSYQKLLRVFISPPCVQGQVRQLDSYQILLKVLRSPRCVPDKPLKSNKLLLRVFRFPMSVGEKKKLLKSYHLLLGVFRGPPSAKVQEKQLNSYQQLIGVFRRPLRVGVKDKFLKFYQQLLRVFGCPPRMGVKEKQLKSSQPLLSMFRSLPWVEVREKLMKSYKRLLKVLRISSRGGVKEKPLKFYQKLLQVFRSLVRADVHGKSLNPYHILLRALRSALSVRVDEPLNSYQIILRVFRRSWRVGVQEKSMKCYQRLLRVFKRPPRERMPEKPLNLYQKLLRVFQIHLPVGVEETRVKSSWRLLRVFRKQARPEVQEKPRKSYQKLLRVFKSPPPVRVQEAPLKSHLHLRVFRKQARPEVQEKPRKSYQKLLRVFKSPPPVRVQEAPLKSHLHLRVFRKQAREGVQEKPLKLNQKLLRVFQSPPPVGGQETPVKSFRQLLRVPRKPACVGVQEKPLKFCHRLFRAFKIPRVWECMGNRRNPTCYC